jgi:hypothetical protein
VSGVEVPVTGVAGAAVADFESMLAMLLCISDTYTPLRIGFS